MELNKEQLEIIIEIFEDHKQLLSELSRGSLFSEQWDLYDDIKKELTKITE